MCMPCRCSRRSGVEDYLYIEDERGLLQLVQMNAVELHPWGATVDDPEHPDQLVFDLDPDQGLAWREVKAGARQIRAELAAVGLESFVRLSGGKGLHVVVPLRAKAGWDQAREFADQLAHRLAERHPDRCVATMSKARREGVIFIDRLRNARGATSVCSWSLRAREGATVAVPLRWDELLAHQHAAGVPVAQGDAAGGAAESPSLGRLAQAQADLAQIPVGGRSTSSLAHQQIAIDRRNRLGPGQDHRHAHLLLNQVQQIGHAGLTGRRQRVHERAPEQHRIRPQRQHPQHVQATANA